MKCSPLRLFLSFLFLLACSLLGLWLRPKAAALHTLVKVEWESGYALALEGGDTLYFADATSWNADLERWDSLALLRGMHTKKQEALSHLALKGLRVKGGGGVQVALPQLYDTLRGEKLQGLLRDTERATRLRLEGMKRQRSELAYYGRTHSVVDDGYNEVMAFATKLEKAWQNDQRCLRLLLRAQRLPKAQAVKHHRLWANGAPYACVEAQGGLALLRPLAKKGNPSKIAGAELDALLRPRPDTLWCHRDSLGRFYRLTRRDSIWRGTAIDDRGFYYQGHFDDSLRRHGFGFGIDARWVQCGIWEKNRFQGERMIYNPDRIYGIDISRYQHEQGGRVYPIDWKRLRITHLGTISKKRVQGKVDYPVRFLFIKATQGVSITSKYYASDLRAARAHGFPVAPYHFFSPKLKGAEQAQHFIKHARLSEATLPPMLDVEPMPSEVEQMGGIDQLFAQMREWLIRVGRAAGRRPVLYLPQYFINRYMDEAPEWLRAYDVWIARYGEFKPYVRLLLWQLSPDGRVEGIRGDVDLNVFNGSEEDFQQWVEGKS